MKGTSIFQFKSWPKIHQPLPRTPRESQQLLNALTSSFRRQLDRAYPASHTHTPNLNPNPDGDRQPLNADSSVHATDQHLHNILDNPLFRIVPPKATPHGSLRSAEAQKRLAEEPMLLFDELVASGSLTPSAIINCLKSQLFHAASVGENGMTEAMKASQAASRVVDWFWASDGATRKTFFQSNLRAWAPTLTKFMVSENLHDTVMHWLKMLINRDLGTANGRIPDGLAQSVFRYLLLDFMDAEIQFGGGLGSALNYYLRASHMVFSSSHEQSNGARKMLLPAGAHLNHASMDPKMSTGQVWTHIYDEYKEVISTLTSTRSLLFVSVALYHPSHPDPRPFVHLTESLSQPKVASWKNNAKRDAFFNIGCDALRILINQKRIGEATRLGQQIQELLPDQTIQQNPAAPNKQALSKEDYTLDRLGLNMT
ncbi:uncharacterized protein N7459_001067 [Penicillium hispanicum]|uniref:uncharacterized protein n=1 Tax=Penicillium hispanicum TaxID=1080232 RepID=UPI002541672C|nr:uncharacterized protein N7459_001067 [Penicillium hispanicum]KAJ5594859.1 hypothetical protein N7459_001067 [Penicillium hispanicum]